MNLRQMLAALRQERDQVEEVIHNLERLALTRESHSGGSAAVLTQSRKRGRPPGSKNRFSAGSRSGNARRVFEQRERVLAAGHGGAHEQADITD